MSEEPVYEGRLLTIRRTGKLLSVEPSLCTLVYSRDELLSETQMIIAALLRDEG